MDYAADQSPFTTAPRAGIDFARRGKSPALRAVANRNSSRISFAVLSCLVLGITRVCSAQSTQPTPLLQQLSVETQQLYTNSRHSMVRVQLPTPQWLDQYNQRQMLLQKWGGQLDPAVREKLIEEQEQYEKALRGATTGPTSSASTQPTNASLQVADDKQIDATVTLNAVGVVVDDQGHAVFPVFVDKKYLGTTPLPAVMGDGQATTATFVGSDARTSVTVLQLANHNGKPITMGHPKPDDGTLTLMIAPDGAARMVVWNNQHPEPGFGILPDGSLGGFGFDKYFLGASTAKPIVDQLIATGTVHRAILGVMMREVSRDDSFRRDHPALGQAPAIRIMSVLDGSAAARGGVQVDDLILSVDDQLVGDAPTFGAVIATRTGDTILKVLRGSQTIQLTVHLEPR